MNRVPTVAIDFRWFDHLSVGSGQYRYAVDLVCGIANLQPEMKFVLLGSRAEPVAEMREVFEAGGGWQYRSVPHLKGRAMLVREQLLYARVLRQIKVDLFHSLHVFVPVFPPVPVVETVHDMMAEIFPDYEYMVRSRTYRLHKWAFPRSVTRAIAISQTTANDLRKFWGYPAQRIDVVFHGPELARTKTAVRDPGDPVALAPYNLEPRKNLGALLTAASGLNARGVKFRLVLFGRAAVTEERERNFLADLKRLGLERNTELTGFLSDEQLSAAYAGASVFVFPSLYEGFGLPVLEAMQAGTCVIVHNDSAMAEIVGDCGVQVNMREPADLATALERVLTDSSVRCELARKAECRGREFGRERMARETLAVYRRVLGLG